jgi:hypothetical protein
VLWAIWSSMESFGKTRPKQFGVSVWPSMEYMSGVLVATHQHDMN